MARPTSGPTTQVMVESELWELIVNVEVEPDK